MNLFIKLPLSCCTTSVKKPVNICNCFFLLYNTSYHESVTPNCTVCSKAHVMSRLVLAWRSSEKFSSTFGWGLISRNWVGRYYWKLLQQNLMWDNVRSNEAEKSNFDQVATVRVLLISFWKIWNNSEYFEDQQGWENITNIFALGLLLVTPLI